jgi:hypothetical protein
MLYTNAFDSAAAILESLKVCWIHQGMLYVMARLYKPCIQMSHIDFTQSSSTLLLMKIENVHYKVCSDYFLFYYITVFLTFSLYTPLYLPSLLSPLVCFPSFKFFYPFFSAICLTFKGTVSRDGYFLRSEHFNQYFLCMR